MATLKDQPVRRQQLPATDFCIAFCGAVLAGMVGVLALLFIIDPYATGRLTWIDHRTSFSATPSKASVSRIRNTAFNAYIVGNSTLQTIDPERLNALTGRSFAQVTVPGSGPMEQTAMMRYMVRERGDSIKTVVIGLDLTWCDPLAIHKTANPFPFWLYEESLFRYAGGLFSADNVEALPKRLRVLLGFDRIERLDGFWNYELHVPAKAYPFPLARAVQTPRSPHSAATALRDVLSGFPASMHISLVLTPVFTPEDPSARFETSTGTQLCKAELLDAARSRPNTVVVDRWQNSALNSNHNLFLDAVHFREPIARDIEQGVALGLAKH